MSSRLEDTSDHTKISEKVKKESSSKLLIKIISNLIDKHIII